MGHQALAEGYDSGLPEELFKDFGKDLDNLTVADPTVNRHQKSDRDAAEWRPARNAGWYAARIVDSQGEVPSVRESHRA